MSHSEGGNFQVLLKIVELKDHSYLEQGVRAFAICPRIGEMVAFLEESGSEQLFEVLAVIHSPQSKEVAGELTLIRVGDRQLVLGALKGA